MSTTTPILLRRYRRRILGWGAAILLATFAIGAVIFIPIVQNDLEDRVEEELIGDGIEGVTASFSGQDGTLTCAQLLDDPARAGQLAQDVTGVRVVDLDRTCVEAEVAADERSDGFDVDEPAVTEVGADDVAATTGEAPVTTEPQVDSINQLVSQDPLFGQLSALLDSAGLTGADGLGGEGPFTVLAPTDAAFDAAFAELGADAFGALTTDLELLRTVLLHHVTAGRLASADFVAGPLDMLDGSTVDVDPDAITFASGGVVAGVADPETQLDIDASNGVVHAVDRLLTPEGRNLGAGTDDPTTGATFFDGQITLTGVVASGDQRRQLIVAAQSQVAAANVIDELAIDLAREITQNDLDRLVALLSAMPPNLASGRASLTGDDLLLIGTYSSVAGETALTDLAFANGIGLDLSARDLADTSSAQELQDELNEFVRVNPVLFEPNSSNLAPESNAVVEQVAARAIRLGGTEITIVGHTDTDGSAATNQELSEVRAARVLIAFVIRGLGAESLMSEGRGGSEPVLVDGVEDKAASRRVEFVVLASEI
jgi:outer membrane protein OmpA-like peptidoglycan-associated protein/uncharacterized surface protein with fasciclin (FAS1) repeats